MDPEYKDILIRERSLILGKVRWTDSFRDDLRRVDLLSETDIDDIENADFFDPVATTIDKISSRPSTNSFGRFCCLLKEHKYIAVANVLLKERECIEWDFQKRKQFRSITDFVESVSDDLLSALSSSSDDFRRDVIVRELEGRLVDLVRYLQHLTSGSSRLYWNLGKVVGRYGAQGAEKVSLKFPPDQLADDLRTLRERDENAWKMVLSHVDDHMASLVDQIRHLQREISKTSEEMNSHSTNVMKLEVTKHVHKQHLAKLEKIVTTQDKQLHTLHREKTENSKDYVFLRKHEVEVILDDLRPYMTKYYLDKKPGSTVSGEDAEDDLAVVLREQIGLILQQIDRFKKRVKETSDVIMELETERDQALKVLGGTEAKRGMVDGLRGRLHGNEKMQRELQHEVSDLKKRLVEMMRQRDEVKKELEELRQQKQEQTAIEARNDSPSGKSVKSTGNVRKGSVKIKPDAGSNQWHM